MNAKATAPQLSLLNSAGAPGLDVRAGRDAHQATSADDGVSAEAASGLSLQGTVDAIIYPRNGLPTDGGFVIVALVSSSPLPSSLNGGDRRGRFVVKGSWPGVARGLTYDVCGKVDVDGKFGPQVTLSAPPELVRPCDRAGVIALLSSEGVTHLGPVRAAAAVDRWGVDGVLGVIEETPELLAELSGISPARAAQAGEAWKAFRARQVGIETVKGLYALRLTAWQVSRLTARYGDSALQVIREQPYRLIYEVDGFGWVKADAIARRANIGDDDPRRVRAAVYCVLEGLTNDGHTVAEVETVVKLVTGSRKPALGVCVSEDLIRLAIRKQIEKGRLTDAPVAGVAEPVALVRLRESEEAVAGWLLGMAQ